MVIGHLGRLKCLDEENIGPRATVGEGLGDEDVVVVGVQSIGSVLALDEHLSWSMESKVMACLDHLRGRDASSLERATFTS